MFDNLASKIQSSIKKITNKHKINEKDVEQLLSEIKLTLLEADINFKIVKNFINTIREKAIGAEILEGLDADQQIIKIVQDELESMLGTNETTLNSIDKNFGIIMMLGLQGSGKTTQAAKLAAYLRKKNKRKPFLIAADIYRPAAIDQLEQLAKQINVPIYTNKQEQDVLKIVEQGLENARNQGANLVIIDTAGRLQIDDELMNELKLIDKQFAIQDKILVLDAMIGQDAINVAREFKEQINVSSTIFTKLDGDTRAGAVLSIRALLDLPVVFIGVGEKIADLEQFYPDRIASRILGMGDVQSLIENIEETINQKEAEEMHERMLRAEFTFTDFQKSLKWVERLGGIGSIFGKLGGMKELAALKKEVDKIDENDAKKRFRKIDNIINSMTMKERNNYLLLKNSSSRRIRVAKGSGTNVSDVNQLLKQFEQMKKMMKQMKNGKGMFPGLS